MEGARHRRDRLWSDGPGYQGQDVQVIRYTITTFTSMRFSLSKSVIDRTVKVPDLLSVAGIHILKNVLNAPGGTSSGINLVVAMHLAAIEKYTSRKLR